MTTISYSKPDVFVIKQYTDDEKETNQMYDESEYAKDNEIAANRLRTLIDGIQPKQTAKDLLDDIFPDNCIWTTKDFHDWMIDVFNFTTLEIQNLQSNYNEVMPYNRKPPIKEPFPNFDKNSNKVIQFFQANNKAKSDLTSCLKTLSTINITQEDFKTKEEYNAFLIKNKEIGLLINSVKQRLNSHITKSSKLIQGQG